jgi:hypothetical protein
LSINKGNEGTYSYCYELRGDGVTSTLISKKIERGGHPVNLSIIGFLECGAEIKI